jgi:heme A synthase
MKRPGEMAKRYRASAALVIVTFVVTIAISALVPGMEGPHAEQPSISSPAQNLAYAHDVSAILGEKVTQIYLLSLLGIILMAIISLMIFVVIGRDKRSA